MRAIDADALEELFREVIYGIANRPEMSGAIEHMVRASAMVIEMIHDAPTIIPERKRGRWIYQNGAGWGETWICSECGEKTTSTVMGKPRYNWCPVCGAEMQEGET